MVGRGHNYNTVKPHLTYSSTIDTRPYIYGSTQCKASSDRVHPAGQCGHTMLYTCTFMERGNEPCKRKPSE